MMRAPEDPRITAPAGRVLTQWATDPAAPVTRAPETTTARE